MIAAIVILALALAATLAALLGALRRGVKGATEAELNKTVDAEHRKAAERAADVERETQQTKAAVLGKTDDELERDINK